jgi:hypothetical protein
VVGFVFKGGNFYDILCLSISIAIYLVNKIQVIINMTELLSRQGFKKIVPASLGVLFPLCLDIALNFDCLLLGFSFVLSLLRFVLRAHLFWGGLVF